MADECKDVATIEEMSEFFYHWEEEGSLEEHFLEIVHLKQTNAESIYSTLEREKSSGEQNCWNGV